MMISPNDSQELGSLFQICHSNLKNSKKHLDYLINERGLSLSDIKKHQIGFFPQNIETLLKYVSEETLLRLNIMGEKRNSWFSYNFDLIFPIYSERGAPVGISARTLLSEDERKIIEAPKYCNSTYPKAEILYGLNHAKPKILQKNQVYVVEGNFDYLTMDSVGIHNTVAIGSSSFSVKQFIKLAQYANEITFLFDNDSAGTIGAQRVARQFQDRGITLKFLRLPEEYKDIDEYFSSGRTIVQFFQDAQEATPNLWEDKNPWLTKANYISTK